MKLPVVFAFIVVILVQIWFSLPEGALFPAARSTVSTGLTGILNFTFVRLGLESAQEGSPMVGALFASFLILFYSSVVFVRMFFFETGRALPNREKQRRVDSIYFLGFILTLVSLVITLANASLKDPAVTLTQNAIALSSTALALVVRSVWLMVLPDEPEIPDGDKVEDGFDALSSKVNTLSENVDAVSAAMVASQEAVEAHVQSTLSRSQRVFDDSREAFTNSLQKTVETFGGSLSEMTAAMQTQTQKINAIEIDSIKIQEELAAAGNAALVSLRDEIEKTAELLVEMNSASANANTQFSSAFQSFDPQQGFVDAAALTLKPLAGLAETDVRALEDLSHELGAVSERVISNLTEFDTDMKQRRNQLREAATKSAEYAVVDGETFADLIGALKTIATDLNRQKPPRLRVNGKVEPVASETSAPKNVGAEQSPQGAAAFPASKGYAGSSGRMDGLLNRIGRFFQRRK